MNLHTSLRTLAVTAAAVAAAAVGSLAPSSASATSAAAAAPTSSATSTTASARAGTPYAVAAFKATNRQRASHDRSRLNRNACLTRYAQAQARAMARGNRMFHQAMSPVQAGCRVGWVGENVAFGFASGADTVNVGWMHSSGHRANLLSGHYRRMGIAAVQSTNGTWYVSQVFGRAA